MELRERDWNGDKLSETYALRGAVISAARPLVRVGVRLFGDGQREAYTNVRLPGDRLFKRGYEGRRRIAPTHNLRNRAVEQTLRTLRKMGYTCADVEHEN